MRILYAADGSEASAHADDLLVAAADRQTLEVTTVTVAPTGAPSIKHLPEFLQSVEGRRAHAEKAAAAAAQRLRDEGFSVEEVTPEGEPADVITGLADEREADLIAVGGGPSSGVVGRLLGSVTTHLLHGSISLLVVRQPPPSADVQIVVATDGSDHASRAVELAAELLDPERCAVTVVSVAVLKTSTPRAPYGGYAISAPNEEAEQQVVEPARQHAEAAAAVLRERGFEPQESVVMGHPVKRLMGVADDLGAALVVVGSRGLNYPERAFLGSTSDQIVRQAPACLIGR